ncbi:hypothetical protein C3L33_14430, partial [Rhododendron williamsianum]
MSKSCKGLAQELVKCLSESDCVKVLPLNLYLRIRTPSIASYIFHMVGIDYFSVEKRPYRECAKEKSPCISSECVGLRETYFNCKRGQACFALSLYLRVHFFNKPIIIADNEKNGRL